MVNSIDRLFDNPNYIYLASPASGVEGIFDFNFKAPIISGGYREQMPSCIACAVLSDDGLAAHSHIGPFANGTQIAASIYRGYMSRGIKVEELSAIIAGTNKGHIQCIESYLNQIPGLKVKAHILDPYPKDVIDMAVDPLEREFLIYRNFFKENLTLNF